MTNNAFSCIIHRTQLLPAVKAAIAAVAGKVTIPVLGNLRLVLDGGMLEVTGTDLDIVIKATGEVIGSQADGATTVPARMFSDFVTRLPESAEIALEADGNFLTAKSGRNRVRLATLPAADWPDLSADMDEATVLEFSGKDLADALGACGYAVSKEETRYYLQGIFMTPVETGITFVATNGHQLREVTLEREPFNGPGIIIPGEACAAMRKLAADNEAVTLSMTESRIRLDCGSQQITSKLIDATYPDFTRVIPAECAEPVTLDAEPAAAAVAAACIVAGTKDRPTRISMDGEGTMTFLCRDPGGDDGETSIDAKGHLPHTLGANGRYLEETLVNAGAPSVSLHSKSPGDPILVLPVPQPQGRRDRAVLMPMRLK